MVKGGGIVVTTSRSRGSRRTLIVAAALAAATLVGVLLMVFGGGRPQPTPAPPSAGTSTAPAASDVPSRPTQPETVPAPEVSRAPWEPETPFPAGGELPRLEGSTLPATRDVEVFAAAIVESVATTDYREADLGVRAARLESLTAACAVTFDQVPAELLTEMCEYAISVLVLPEETWTGMRDVAQVEVGEISGMVRLDAHRYLAPMDEYARPLRIRAWAGLHALDVTYDQSVSWVDPVTGAQVPEMVYSDTLGVLLACEDAGERDCRLVTVVPGGFQELERSS